jgi:hypothetical protein
MFVFIPGGTSRTPARMADSRLASPQDVIPSLARQDFPAGHPYSEAAPDFKPYSAWHMPHKDES